mgnify:FL=1
MSKSVLFDTKNAARLLEYDLGLGLFSQQKSIDFLTKKTKLISHFTWGLVHS